MGKVRRERARLATVGVVMLSVAAGVCGAAQASGGPAMAKGGAGARFSVAAADWTACQVPGQDESNPDKPTWRQVDLECATVNVPRDSRQPDGGTVAIPLARKRAGSGGAKGSLFLNPGGPGGSGISDLADQLATQAGDSSLRPYELDQRVIDNFDLVTFDPRGVGRADPLYCTDQGKGDEKLFKSVPPFPVNPADEKPYNDAIASVTKTCVGHTGDWVRQVSTEDVARDMELLRQAVDPSRPLNYYGMSYGSYLGAVYADLFPQQVGAVAVDGVIDPSLWSTDGVKEAEATAAGTQKAVEGFIAACAKAGNSCAYSHGQNAQQITDRLFGTLRKLRDRENDASRKNEYQEVVGFIQDGLYQPSGFADMASNLVNVETAVDAGNPIPELPGGSEPENPPANVVNESDVQNKAVTCADTPLVLDPPKDPNTPVDWTPYEARVDAASEFFGRSWLDEARWCENWPEPAHRYAGSFNSATNNPVLAIGNTYDPATPLKGAQHLTQLFPNSGLVTLDGYGHQSYVDPSACAIKALGDYLLNPGTRLEPGLICKPDHDPFSDSLTNSHRRLPPVQRPRH